METKPLGRGLSSLLGGDFTDPVDDGMKITMVGIYELCPGKYQPRHHFDQESLQSLVQSIQEKGVIHPILVRPANQALANYEIIAGERRWQAARRAGLEKVPVIVREMSDLEALETGLIENIQRHDLTPLEEAEGYRRLMDEFSYTQEVLSKTLGKSRSHIANQLRLLHLPQSVKDLIEKGLLTAGHAKAIAGSNCVEDLANKIVRSGLSVRQAERLAQKSNQDQKDAGVSKERSGYEDEDAKSIEDQITDALSLKVSLKMGKSEKKLTIFFHSLEELDDLVDTLTRNRFKGKKDVGLQEEG